MAFILGSLVSAPSVTAVAGGLPEEIDAIWEIIVELQDQLNDLHVTWEKVTDKPYEVLHYEQTGMVVTVLPDIKHPKLKELAVWEIVKDPAFAHNTLILYDSSIYAEFKQPSPSSPFCAIEIGWYRSQDVMFSSVMTWSSIDTISTTSDNFILDRESGPETSLKSKYNFIAFGIRNSGTCSLDGVVQDFSGTITIHLPPDQSLTRIL